VPRITLDDVLSEMREEDPAFVEHERETQPSRDVALLLIRTRLSLGLTQTEFGKRAGVTQSYIAQLESGVANPTIQKLTSVLRKNGVELHLEAAPFVDDDSAAKQRGTKSRRRAAAESARTYDANVVAGTNERLATTGSDQGSRTVPTS
jgi:transcriptional regulator with XRE-family HTH domain